MMNSLAKEGVTGHNVSKNKTVDGKATMLVTILFSFRARLNKMKTKKNLLHDEWTLHGY